MYVVVANIKSFLLLNPTFPAAKFECFIPVMVSRAEPRGIRVVLFAGQHESTPGLS